MFHGQMCSQKNRTGQFTEKNGNYCVEVSNYEWLIFGLALNSRCSQKKSESTKEQIRRE